MWFVIYLLIVLVVIIATCKYYFGTTTWCKSDVKLHGKTVIITGGNMGLGKATALDLASRGAKIIIASRNGDKAKETITEIKEKTGNQNIHYMYLNLIDLDSVRQFAKEFLKKEPRLDILINNAGIGDWSYRTLGRQTKQSFNLVFGVNHLGHFLLTFLLLDILKNTGNARIINVSSLRHLWRRRPFSFDKGPSSDGTFYPDLCGYSGSKLANLMHVKALSKMLKGTSVTANSVHPGLANTDIVTGPFKDILPGCFYFIVDSFLRFCSLDANAGAQTIIYASVEESLKTVTGIHLGHCQYAMENKLAQDAAACQDLWECSLKMCDLK